MSAGIKSIQNVKFTIGMNEYKEALMNALDIIKDSERCRGCTDRCLDCEYFLALTKIKGAIYGYCKLKEREIPKMVDGIPNGHIPKHGYCPNCGGFVMQTFKDARCVVCGQVLKWEEEND